MDERTNQRMNGLTVDQSWTMKAGPEEKDSRVSASDAVLQQYSGERNTHGRNGVRSVIIPFFNTISFPSIIFFKRSLAQNIFSVRRL